MSFLLKKGVKTLGDKPEINIKNLFYGFMELSWIKRCTLLKKYNLLDEADKDKGHVKILEKMLERAKENNCLEKLYDEVVNSQ